MWASDQEIFFSSSFRMDLMFSFSRPSYGYDQPVNRLFAKLYLGTSNNEKVTVNKKVNYHTQIAC